MITAAMVAAWQDRGTAETIPPLCPDALFLLDLTQDERGNSRILTLTAQRDPVLSTRLLAAANSTSFSHLDLTTSTDVAIRRLGVEVAYGLMADVSGVPLPENSLKFSEYQGILFRKTTNMTMTAKRLANWAAVDGTSASVVWLACLAYVFGVYAGLVTGGKLGEQFGRGLDSLAKHDSASFSNCEELEGFEQLSAKLVQSWGMDPRVGQAILGVAPTVKW